MTPVSDDGQRFSATAHPRDRQRAPQVMLSLMTGPFLAGLLGVRAIAEGLMHLGIASEELFRGERLPVLQSVPLRGDDPDAAEIDPE